MSDEVQDLAGMDKPLPSAGITAAAVANLDALQDDFQQAKDAAYDSADAARHEIAISERGLSLAEAVLRQALPLIESLSRRTEKEAAPHQDRISGLAGKLQSITQLVTGATSAITAVKGAIGPFGI